MRGRGGESAIARRDGSERIRGATQLWVDGFYADRSTEEPCVNNLSISFARLSGNNDPNGNVIYSRFLKFGKCGFL